jgi:predicted NAD/FAD-dependent oxidoreductase
MLLLGSELGLSDSGIIQFEAAEPISTITETSVKGLTDLPGIVIQSGPEFAEENFAATSDTIFKRLSDALPISGDLDVEGMSVQKWRFAKRKEHALKCYFNEDESNFLWHAGDGYNAPRIEGAFLSGERVAESIISSLSIKRIPNSQEPGNR